MDTLLKQLKSAYPTLSFKPGVAFSWSAKDNSIIYRQDTADIDGIMACWSLLHEAGHALLGHKDYQSDFELLLLEVAAWERANDLAKNFGYHIDPDHIQDCLDTYRDWLYQRSTCPTCLSCSLQRDSKTYVCFNCGTVWHVSPSRHCRPYRRKQKEAPSREPLSA